MAVVSALKATRSGRVAVHLDGAFFCTVGEALLVRLGLFAGRSLTDEQVALLQSEASAERALADAHRLLAQRPRARAELQTRLTAKGHPQEAVQRALQLLSRRAPGGPPQAAQRRAYQLLLRRGFSTTVAYAAVRRWSVDAGNTDESS